MVAFRAPGRDIATRLDVLGLGPDAVRTMINQSLHESTGLSRDAEFLESIDTDFREQIEAETAFSDTLDADQ